MNVTSNFSTIIIKAVSTEIIIEIIVGRLCPEVSICGNFIKKHHQEQCYTTNTDITSVRTILAVSAKMGWGLSVIDVTTAFLNAALPEEEGEVLARPPRILSEFGLIPEGSLWRARRAVYGLRVAPRSWGIERDRELRKLRITVGGKQCRLAQSQVDPAMWAIIEDGPYKLGHQVQPLGYLLSYVDDFLIAGDDVVRKALCQALEGLGRASVQVRCAMGRPMRRCTSRPPSRVRLMAPMFCTSRSLWRTC